MNKSEEKNILKALSVLGSVQVFNILIGIIKSKVISILLGPAGIGIQSLYQSSSDIISSISNMGLSTTAVKNISVSYNESNINQVAYISAVFHKLIKLTGLVAMLLCVLLSPVLSYLNFGELSHTPWFFLLGVSLYIIQQVAGYTTLLQGCRSFKKMASGTAIGNALGLVVCIPLYYIWGEYAIVPVLVLGPLFNCVVLYIITKKLNIPRIDVGYKEALIYGKDMLKTGFFVCLQGLFALLYIYILRLYISHSAGMAEVGLFNAGIVIVNTYVGLVFSSMGTEYYPRLSSISDDKAFISAINDQVSRSITLLTPLLCLLMILMPIVVQILYTKEFTSIITMCYFLLASVCFKIYEWCIGFSLLACGKTKLLFKNEVSFKIYTLIISILLFSQYGITGIGVSYLISEFIFCIQSYFIAQRSYGFTFNNNTLVVFARSAVIMLLCISALLYVELYKYIICTICLTYTSILLFRYLKRVAK